MRESFFPSRLYFIPIMHYKYLVARIIFDLKKLEIKLTIFTISHVNSQ